MGQNHNLELSFRADGRPQHTRTYLIRRFFNWFPMGLTYAFLYMGRYNLTVAKNALGSMMTKADFGIIFGIGTFAYALAFLINGPLTDKIGGKRAIQIAALGAGTANLLMGFMLYLVLAKNASFNLVFAFSALYLMNMYFQSFGAVSIVKVNSAWFHVRERGVFGGIFGILISLGIYFAFDWSEAIVNATRAVVSTDLGLVQRILRSLVGATDATIDQTWWVFFIPAILLYTFFIIETFLLRDNPQKAGLYNLNTADASSGEADTPLLFKELLIRILTNKIIIIVAAIELCTGVLRQGIMHWYHIYNFEVFKLGSESFMHAHWGLILMIAGSSGGMLAGFLSDRVFGSRRGPVAALLYGTMVFATILMIFALKNPVLLAVVVTLISFCVIGTHGMLSGTATMDFGGSRGAATAVGLIDGAVYLGTGIQSLAIGFISGVNWAFWPIFLAPFSIIGLMLAIKIWHAKPQPKKKS